MWLGLGFVLGLVLGLPGVIVTPIVSRGEGRAPMVIGAFLGLVVGVVAVGCGRRLHGHEPVLAVHAVAVGPAVVGHGSGHSRHGHRPADCLTLTLDP
jgi:hypothetical protein